MRGRNALRLAVSASLLSSAGLAPAQQVEVQRLEEIIVTAQKREERLRDVPQSVTAITDVTLERLQANDFSDYVARVPGMTAVTNQPGSSRLTLRGLNTGGVASTIGTYIDETPFGSSTALAEAAELAPDLDPFDIERIEVLRGPQGTLYGASTLGGLIKFVTQEPSTEDLEFSARVSGESTEGGDESWGVRALGNVPLGDKAAMRLSGWYRSQGGFIDDPARGVEDIDGSETTGGRANFLVNATEDLSFRLSATTQEIDSDAPTAADYFPVPLEPVSGETSLSRGFSEARKTSYDIYNGTIDWDLGWASFLSSTSYSELDQDSQTDATVAIPIGVTPLLVASVANTEKFTQEFRLTSPASKNLEWLVGLFYSDEDSLISDNVLLGPPPGTPVPGLPVPFNLMLDSEYEEVAAFGTITYYFTEQFDVAVGARYSTNDQTAVQSGTAAPNATVDSDDSVTTYSLAPRWRINDDTMLYARVASGYRPGGPNVRSAFGTIPSQFDSDTAVNYELGVKTDFFDGMLRLDAAVFYIDWEDIQLLVSDGVVAGNSNGGTAESQGVEWAATLSPVDGLSIVWSGAYSDAELTSDTDPPDAPLVLTGGEDGDSLPYVPEWSSSLDVDYEWDVFTDASAFVGGSWRYVGDQMTGFSTELLGAFGEPQIELPSYDVIDLRAGVDFERFTIELFAKNVTDEHAVLSFANFGQVPPGAPPNGTAGVLRPRTIGLSLSTRF